MAGADWLQRNLGIKFFTPEGMWEHQKRVPFDPEVCGFDPRSLGIAEPAQFPSLTAPAGVLQLVVLVGSPGSGKSSLALDHFGDYERVNQDTLGSVAKCLKTAKCALQAGKSCVIDNQNKQAATRAGYLQLAREFGASPVAVVMDVPKELCLHLNIYRTLNANSAQHRNKPVPPMVIHSYYKQLELPTAGEGFAQVLTVGLEHFAPKGDASDLRSMRMFLR